MIDLFISVPPAMTGWALRCAVTSPDHEFTLDGTYFIQTRYQVQMMDTCNANVCSLPSSLPCLPLPCGLLPFRPFTLPFEHMTRSQHHISRCVQHEVKRSLSSSFIEHHFQIRPCAMKPVAAYSIVYKYGNQQAHPRIISDPRFSLATSGTIRPDIASLIPRLLVQ